MAFSWLLPPLGSGRYTLLSNRAVLAIANMSLPRVNERRESTDRILDDPGSFGRSDASSVYSEKTIIDARRSRMGAHSPTPSEVVSLSDFNRSMASISSDTALLIASYID